MRDPHAVVTEVRSGREIQPIAYPRDEVRPEDFRVVEVPVRAPEEGEVVVRNTWTSVDAAHRLRLRERAPEGYFGAFALGAPMDGILTVGTPSGLTASTGPPPY